MMRTFSQKVTALITGATAALAGMNPYGDSVSTARTFSTEYPLILPAR